MRRIYLSRIQKWLIGSGITLPFLVGLFAYLSFIGAIDINSHSGSNYCIDNICEIYINFTANEDIFIYPNENWSVFTLEPETESKLYRSWGSYWREIDLTKGCTGSWCGCYWCTSSNTAKFSYAFREGRDYEIKIEVNRNNTSNHIKWGFGELDPMIYGDDVISANKIYDSDEKEVTFKDTKTNEVISKIKLESSLNERVGTGFVDVAQIKINNSIGDIPLGKLFYGIELEDLDRNNESITRKIGYKYENISNYTQTYYDRICEKGVYKNGSTREICTEVEKEREAFKVDLIDLDLADKINVGITKVHIFAEVKNGDNVEWIPSFYNSETKVKEWASWTEGLNDDLISYYNMTDGTDLVNGLHNMSAVGSGGTFSTTNAFIVDSYYSDNTDYHTLNASENIFNLIEPNMTLNFWFRPTTISTGEYGILGKYNTGSSGYLMAQENSDGSDISIQFPGFDTLSSTDDVFYVGEYVMITLVKNTTGLALYVNATYLSSIDFPGTYAPDYTKPLAIGTKTAAKTDENYIDEMSWHNRSLSEGEIIQMFNNRTGISYQDVGDETDPETQIIHPTNTTYTTNTLDLNFTASDETELDTCWFYNGTLNVSFNDCTSNFTAQNADEGSNTWTIFANDTSNNINYSEVTFFVDSEGPNVTIEYPENASKFTSEIIDINFTALDDNLDSCWWSNNTGTTNNSIDCDTNITGLSWDTGENVVIVYANDSYGNIGNDIITFFYDIYPHFENGTLERLADGANISSRTDVASRINIVNGDFTNGTFIYWYKSNGTEFRRYTDITFSSVITDLIHVDIFPEDTFEWNVYWCADSINDVFVNCSFAKENNYTFRVDITSPSVDLNNPLNNENINNENINVSGNASEYIIQSGNIITTGSLYTRTPSNSSKSNNFWEEPFYDTAAMDNFTLYLVLEDLAGNNGVEGINLTINNSKPDIYNLTLENEGFLNYSVDLVDNESNNITTFNNWYLDGDLKYSTWDNSQVAYWSFDDNAYGYRKQFKINDTAINFYQVNAIKTDNCLKGGCYNFTRENLNVLRFTDISYDYHGAINNLFGGESSLVSNITIMAWARKTETSPGINQQIFSFGESPNSHSGLRFNGDGGFYMSLGAGAGGDAVTCSQKNLSNNTWYHFAMTYDHNLSIAYVDGEQVCNLSVNMNPTTYQFSVGVKTTSDSDYLSGSVDELRLYKRVLNKTEIDNQRKLDLNDTYLPTEFGTGIGWKVGVVACDFAICNEVNSSETRGAPKISFIDPTPDNGQYSNKANVIINTSIIELDLSNLTYNWNGTNYTIYDDSLVLMYNFDNVSSLGENNTNVVDLSSYGNDGTLYNSTSLISGVYNLGLNFSSTSEQFLEVPHNESLEVGVPEFTASAWLKPGDLTSCGDTGSPGCIIMNKENVYEWALTSSGDLHWAIRNTNPGWAWYDTNVNFPSETWNHFSLVYDGSTMKVYKNGTLVQTRFSTTGNIDHSSYKQSFRLGDREDNPGNNYDGLIDEVMIWNRSLSSDEVNQLYMTNLYKFNQTQWYLTVNQTKDSTDLLTEGNYTYQVYAEDGSGNLNETEERSIFIDVTNPETEIVYPVNVSLTDDKVDLNFSATDNFVLDKCWYNNLTDNSTLNDCDNNFTQQDIVQGWNNWTLYANDSAGNLNSSLTEFYVDSFAPNTTIEYPTNTTYIIETLDLNFTVVDNLNLDTCWWDNGTDNSTIQDCQNVTGISAFGSTTWILYANDTLNNINSSEITFYVDTITGFQVDKPNKLNVTNGGNFDINWTNATTSGTAVTYNVSLMYSNGTRLERILNSTKDLGYIYSVNNKVFGDYYIEVLATTSLGKNETANSSVFHIYQDFDGLNISISEGVGVLIFANYTPNSNNTPPYNQTSSVGVFTAQNNYSSNLVVLSSLNETNSEIDLKCSGSNNYNDAVILNQTNQTIVDIVPNESRYIWCWMDIRNPISYWSPDWFFFRRM